MRQHHRRRRRNHPSIINHRAKPCTLSCWSRAGMEPRRWKRRGSGLATLNRSPHQQVYGAMIQLSLSSPVRGALGHSWRSSSSSAAMRGCQTVFWICQHCDRGHRYCSPECRDPARRQQLRLANRRHQRSPEGRLDHRDRQCEYRERCAQARVTDQGSPTITSGAPLRCGKAKASASVAFVPGQRSFGCVICGRTSRFVDPFPSIPRRR